MSTHEFTEADIDEIAFAIYHGTPWQYVLDNYDLERDELIELLQTRIANTKHRGATPVKTPLNMERIQTDDKHAKVRKVGRYWYVHLFGQNRPAARCEQFLEALLWADLLTRSYEKKTEAA